MKKTLLAVSALVALGALAAGELDEAQLIGTTDKARAIDYEAGETMTFTLTLKNAKPFPAGAYEIRWTRTGDDGQKQEGKAPLSAETPLVVKTSLDKPGFVRIVAEVYDAKGKLYRKQLHVDPKTPEGKRALNRWERADKRVFFDGGAAVHPETLQSVPEPKDYDAFWAKRKARLAKVPMNPVLTERKSSNPKVKVYTFSVSCAGPRPVSGHDQLPRLRRAFHPEHSLVWSRGPHRRIHQRAWLRAGPRGGVLHGVLQLHQVQRQDLWPRFRVAEQIYGYGLFRLDVLPHHARAPVHQVAARMERQGPGGAGRLDGRPADDVGGGA